jgi:serine/threonine-protein kinase
VIDREIHVAPSRDRNHPLIGTVVGGRYRVQRLVGRGAMGTVFEAENMVLRRMVALKIVESTASPEAALRLQREAHLVAAVQHPNVCDVYDAGSLEDGRPFIVLERLFGETLEAFLRRKRVHPIAPIVDIFLQVLSGLHAAHGAKILHRDLKPQNVFLAERLGCAPIVKLLDFGIAKDLSGTRTPRSMYPGMLIGTLHYMAPEQLRAESLTPRADLFAVGVMLYEALVGTHPFAAESIDDFQANLLRCKPLRPSLMRPDLTYELEAVVLRALAPEPDARWSTAMDFQRALSAAAPRLPESTPPDSKVDSSGPESTGLQPLR